jgi:hypothetical protein
MALTPEHATDLAKSLVAYATAVRHLETHHPGGEADCTHQPDYQEFNRALREVEEESVGPLERSLQRGLELTGEVSSALAALRTYGLERGLLGPKGVTLQVTDALTDEVSRHIEELLALLSREARMTLVQVIYLTGDRGLAELLGLPPHERVPTGLH